MSEKPKVHPIQRAWAAGVFDARVTVPRHGTNVRIESTDEGLVRRFYETVNVGRCFPRTKERCINPVWVWEAVNLKDAHEVCTFMLPLLSAKKTKECADLISRVERNPYFERYNRKKVTGGDTAEGTD